MTDEELLARLIKAATQFSRCHKIRFAAAALSFDGEILSFGYNHNPVDSGEWECKRDCAGGIRSVGRTSRWDENSDG